MKIPFLRSVVPSHVFCLLPDAVTYASVRRSSPAGFAQARSFAYPPMSVSSGPSGTPLFSREAIAEAVATARRVAEGRLSRASVVFPDAWARMLPVDFDALPDDEEGAREMAVWKLKKLLPGVTSELSVVFREMPPIAGSARRLLVAAAPVEMLQSVERSFESLGVRVGALAPSSLVLFEGLSPVLGALAGGDYALVHRDPGSLVFVVARDGSPMFFRQRPSEGEPADHEQEVRLSLSYYEDKLKGPGLRAIYLHDELGGRDLAASFPLEPVRLSGDLLGAEPSFDESIASRPELLAGFAAVYGRR